MALDPRYIASVELQSYFNDKATGLPLTAGTVWFWEDDARTVPKLVYELVGVPGTYNYQPLPNPIQLSSTGTWMDEAGNNIQIYYFPYDAQGNLQLYYIQVFDQYGSEQFTREAWPNEAITQGNGNTSNVDTGNKLDNPTFAAYTYVNDNPHTINITGAGTINVGIAPRWVLNITSTGAGTVTVQRTSIAGNLAYPYNPPYTLTITPGANVSAISLTQQLLHNPDIWSPQNAGSTNGWLASSILLAPLSSITMQYAPSQGPAQTILTANNLTGVYTQFNNTVQLAPATNTDTSDPGYVNINIVLPIASPTTLSNVQVLGVEQNIKVVYDQTPVNRQIALLSDFYGPQLAFKPIPSYLSGWQFPLNPAQFLGTSGPAFNTGANTSNYVWDNTIVFQTVNNSYTFNQGLSGAFRIYPNQNTQVALIQYIPALAAGSLLYDNMCVMVEAACQTATYPVTVSIWTTAGALPSTVVSNASLVTGLDANGYPTVAAGWSEVVRGNLGNAKCIMQNPGATDGLPFNYYPFNGWVPNPTQANLSAYIAIVVGTGVFGNGNNFSVESITLQKGYIPSITGGQTESAVIQECQAYYEKSFSPGTVPAQNVGANTGETVGAQIVGAGVNNQLLTHIPLKVTKSSLINVITTYNPAAANGQVRNETVGADCTNVFVANPTQNGFFVTYTTSGGSSAGNINGLHWVVDARLGY